MTPIEIVFELLARFLFWLVLACALYGCWLDEIEKRQGRAIDYYLNGVQTRMYL